MIIEKYRTDYRRDRSERPQALRVHRPPLKDKYRSFAPTVFSLLEHEQVMTVPKNETDDAQHSTESHRRIHEIPERPRVTESLISSDSKHGTDDSSSTYCSCVTSHRTEDIAVREDEDGIRTHFCPLDEKEDSEDTPDEAMKADLEAILNGECSLKSEDIPCLMAEGPCMMDSEDSNWNKCSDVDASTHMIYGPTRNKSLIDQDATFSFLLDNSGITPYQIEPLVPCPTVKLDQETMKKWAEESSDDTEYCTDDKRETEMLLEDVSDESDMEEFNDTVNTENNQYKNLESSESEETCIGPQQKLHSKEQPCSETDNREHDKISQKSNIETDTQNIDAETIKYNTPSSQQTDIAKSTERKVDNTEVGDSSNFVKENPEANLIETHATDAAFSEETATETNEKERHISSELMDAAMRKILCIEIDTSRSSDDRTKNHSETVVTQNEPIAINETIVEKNRMITTEHSSLDKSYPPDVKLSLTEDTSKGSPVDPVALSPGDEKPRVKYEKKGHLEPTAMLQLIQPQSNTDKPDLLNVQPPKTGDVDKRPLVDPLASLPADVKIKVKDEKRGDLAMEPRVESLQKNVSRNEDPEPDLATALRFMTEVYHTKDDEDLYLDTLDFHEPDEVSTEKRKSAGALIVPDDLKLPSKQEFKTPCPSSPFEPAQTEEQRGATRPRNKISKFFRSFKQRFTKKA